MRFILTVFLTLTLGLMFNSCNQSNDEVILMNEDLTTDMDKEVMYITITNPHGKTILETSVEDITDLRSGEYYIRIYTSRSSHSGTFTIKE